MSQPIYDGGESKIVTGTGAVTTGPCQLIGFYVNSTTLGTVALTDGAVTVSGTITPLIGFHRFPANIGTSLTATIGGTLNVTFFWAN